MWGLSNSGTASGAFYGAIIGGSIGFFGKEFYLEGGRHFSYEEFKELPSSLTLHAKYFLNGVNIKRRVIYDFLYPGVETAL